MVIFPSFYCTICHNEWTDWHVTTGFLNKPEDYLFMGMGGAYWKEMTLPNLTKSEKKWNKVQQTSEMLNDTSPLLLS